MNPESESNNTIWASSFVSNRTRKGMISLRWREHEIQLDCEQARALSLNLARAAEASETDEMCLALLGHDPGLQMLNLMRQYREVRLGIQKAEWTPEEIAEKLKKTPTP